MNYRSFREDEPLIEWAANLIRDGLSLPGSKNLLVTGGQSCIPIYDRLAAMDIGWPRVSVTLTDERFVDPSSPDSNEGMIRAHLLQGHAAQANFVPLKGAGPTAQDDAEAAADAVRALIPFDVVLVSQGEDGHIASIFPDDPHAWDYLNPRDPRLLVGIDEAGMAPFVPRITMTLGGIIAAKLVVLLVRGQTRREVFSRSQTDWDFDPPVAMLMRHSRAPVHVLFGP